MRLFPFIFKILFLFNHANPLFASRCFGCFYNAHSGLDKEVHDPTLRFKIIFKPNSNSAFTALNEDLDEKIHDPLRTLVMSFKPEISAQALCSTSQTGSQPRKSALKAPQTVNPGFIKKGNKKVSWSSETEDSKGRSSITNQEF